MAARISAVRVKANRSYTVEEAAEAVGVTPQTVRRWISEGLEALTTQRPFLILGHALKAFLAKTKHRRKRPLKLGEFFCLSCKAPRRAALDLATYHPQTSTSGRMEAFCNCCESVCARMVRAEDLPQWRAIYVIDHNDSSEA
ncbi:MAG: helix-turn-helix domain-containing protein [Pseudomonadota bacterium]